MTHCLDCKYWLKRRETQYQDGQTIVNYQSKQSDEHGLCRNTLQLETFKNFGCINFEQGSPADQVEITFKNGAPWQHSVSGPCPNCKGAGSSAGEPDPTTGALGVGLDNRCAGTGMVRYYDDGYIGEEQTRLHPVEKAIRQFAAVMKLCCDGHGQPKGPSEAIRLDAEFTAIRATIAEYHTSPEIVMEALERELAVPEEDLDQYRIETRKRFTDVLTPSAEVLGGHDGQQGIS
jgi:hypothetical protein